MSKLNNRERDRLPLEDFALPSLKLMPIIDVEDLEKLGRRLTFISCSDSEKEEARRRAIQIAKRKGLPLSRSLAHAAMKMESVTESCACDGLDDEAKAACLAYAAQANATGESVTFSADESETRAALFAREVTKLSKPKDEGGFADTKRRLFYIIDQKSIDNLSRVITRIPASDVFEIAKRGVEIGRRLGLKIPVRLELACVQSDLQSEAGFSDSEQSSDEALSDIHQAYEYASQRNLGLPSVSSQDEITDENLQQATEQAREFARSRNSSMKKQ